MFSWCSWCSCCSSKSSTPRSPEPNHSMDNPQRRRISDAASTSMNPFPPVPLPDASQSERNEIPDQENGTRTQFASDYGRIERKNSLARNVNENDLFPVTLGEIPAAVPRKEKSQDSTESQGPSPLVIHRDSGTPIGQSPTNSLSSNSGENNLPRVSQTSRSSSSQKSFDNNQTPRDKSGGNSQDDDHQNSLSSSRRDSFDSNQIPWVKSGENSRSQDGQDRDQGDQMPSLLSSESSLRSSSQDDGQFGGSQTSRSQDGRGNSASDDSHRFSRRANSAQSFSRGSQEGNNAPSLGDVAFDEETGDLLPFVVPGTESRNSPEPGNNFRD
ncbi:MAG TPA: hypothetical protein VLE96_03445 [Chlamydiales bacterium]|nr:hypothetical protein [Chlamydiales bacterium]